MSYEISKNETIAENTHRILHEELAEAIHSLENPGENKEEAIHSVRKRIKKIRAVFRLVKSELDDKLFRQENIRYRNIGHMLSHLRDATVMINTLNKLKQAYPKAVAAKTYMRIEKKLQYRQEQISRDFFEEKNNIQNVLNALKEAQQEDLKLPIEKDSFRVFSANLKLIYKRGIKAFEHVIHDPSVDAFHELRKEVKNMGYHTRILSPIWPGFFLPYAKEMDKLAEFLGDDHDLGVLGEEIEKGELSTNKTTREKILLLIKEQRERLQQLVYPIARRIFAEEPSKFIDRYKLYWNIWHTANEQQSSKQMDNTSKT